MIVKIQTATNPSAIPPLTPTPRSRSSSVHPSSSCLSSSVSPLLSDKTASTASPNSHHNHLVPFGLVSLRLVVIGGIRNRIRILTREHGSTERGHLPLRVVVCLV